MLVNPVSFRLGVSIFWKSTWSLYNIKNYKYLFYSDLLFFEYLFFFFKKLLKSSFYDFLLSHVRLYRLKDKIIINIYYYSSFESSVFKQDYINEKKKKNLNIMKQSLLLQNDYSLQVKNSIERFQDLRYFSYNIIKNKKVQKFLKKFFFKKKLIFLEKFLYTKVCKNFFYIKKLKLKWYNKNKDKMILLLVKYLIYNNKKYFIQMKKNLISELYMFLDIKSLTHLLKIGEKKLLKDIKKNFNNFIKNFLVNFVKNINKFYKIYFFNNFQKFEEIKNNLYGKKLANKYLKKNWSIYDIEKLLNNKKKEYVYFYKKIYFKFKKFIKIQKKVKIKNYLNDLYNKIILYSYHNSNKNVYLYKNIKLKKIFIKKKKKKFNKLFFNNILYKKYKILLKNNLLKNNNLNFLYKITYTKLMYNCKYVLYNIYFYILSKYLKNECKILFINNNFFRFIKNFKLNIYKIIFNNINAKIIANYIITSFKFKYNLWETLRPILVDLSLRLELKQISGFKISVAGRFKRAQRATFFWRKKGGLSASTTFAGIDYQKIFYRTKYGVSTINVWITLGKYIVHSFKRMYPQIFPFFFNLKIFTKNYMKKKRKKIKKKVKIKYFIIKKNILFLKKFLEYRPILYSNFNKIFITNFIIVILYKYIFINIFTTNLLNYLKKRNIIKNVFLPHFYVYKLLIGKNNNDIKLVPFLNLTFFKRFNMRNSYKIFFYKKPAIKLKFYKCKIIF